MITLSQTGGTSGITTITISATSRSEMSDFVKKYTLANQNKSMLLAVTQKGYVPSGKYISFKPDSFSFDSSGGTGSLQVTSNDDWYIDFGSWVYPSEMRGNGNTIIGIRVEANTGSTRSGNITGYCLSDSAETASASVSQVGSYVKPYLSVSPLRTPVIASGGTGFTLAVTSNQEWNAYTDARWVTINTVSGSGNGNISFDVVENATDIEREANIYVVSSANSLSATSVIAQSAQTQQEPYLAISPSAKTMSTSGGSFTITVSSNTEWETAVVYDGQGRTWIALDKLDGYGDDVVEVRIDPDVQESINGRSAYISFFNNKEGLKTECNIEQTQPNTRKVYYTSSNGNVITPNNATGWGANIVSNTYVGGQGIIEFDGDVTTIPSNAFRGKTTLRTIVFPESVTTVSDYAFSGDTGLSAITFYEDCESFGSEAFEYCWALSKVYYYGSADSYAVIENNIYASVLNDPTIRYDLYINEELITSLDLSSLVGPVAASAFRGCTSITSVTIGNNVTEIKDYSFRNCQSLKVVYVGSGVTAIGKYAFQDSSLLDTFYFYPTTKPSVYYSTNGSFNGVAQYGTLHYPNGSDYSGWQSGSGYITVQGFRYWTFVGDL